MPQSYPRKSFQRKAQTPQQQLERALQIAHEKGLKVAFAGDGFWVVPSDSEALKGLYHVVTRVGSSLKCECLYAQRGKVCAHRAIVWEYLKQQTEAAAATVPQASSMRPVADRAVAQAASAQVAQLAQAVKVSPAFQKRIDNTIFPSAAPKPAAPAQRPAMDTDEGDQWGRYQDARMGGDFSYVPSDYKSHEYR
jgi:hypothetical protein